MDSWSASARYTTYFKVYQTRGIVTSQETHGHVGDIVELQHQLPAHVFGCTFVADSVREGGI
eukprot:5845226-Pyramimonas_sp.AAC.1